MDQTPQLSLRARQLGSTEGRLVLACLLAEHPRRGNGAAFASYTGFIQPAAGNLGSHMLG